MNRTNTELSGITIRQNYQTQQLIRTITENYEKKLFDNTKTSLMRRLQAKTLPDATPPVGQIHPLSKMVVTFKPLMGL